MKVRLVSYSQPTPDFKQETGMENVQDLIAYCARVSNPANQLNKETTERLINYLIKNKHWSPFEMASATVEIETTRDIGRQILRHRSFSFQEFSQRYADPQKIENTFVTREARLQDTKNRQNSIETNDKELKNWWKEQQERCIKLAKEVYNEAIKKGIAKEQARAVLPEGLTKSRMYMTGTIRSFIHYIELRSGNGTQKEHQEIALAVAEAISKIFPLAKKFVTKEK